MKLDLSMVTLVCMENQNPEAVVRLLAHQFDLATFGDVKLLNHFKGYKQFMYFENYELWKYIRTPYALTIHFDGFILHPDQWTPEFLEYDWVGAPWPHAPEHDEAWGPARVGNGGFSLRSKRLMVRVAELPWIDIPSDCLVCRHYRPLLEGEGFKFAPVELAARFSTEVTVPETVERPFGFHGQPAIQNRYPIWASNV